MKVVTQTNGSTTPLSSIPYWAILLAQTPEDVLDNFRPELDDGELDEPHADEANWLFLSTSGIHGSHQTLDEWTPESKKLTVLVVKPRILQFIMGHVEFEAEHVPVLRRLVTETLAAVEKSQGGNIEKGR